MKKYVAILFLLLAQNVCAMESNVLTPFEEIHKNNEKCKLVAKYLHKYPAGRNEEEKKAIDVFGDDEERFILARCVEKYKNILKNIEAEEAWHCMYEKYSYRYDAEKSLMYENVPLDIRRKILSDVLYEYIANYCAFNSALEFIKLDQYGRYHNCRLWVYDSCVPHFFSELTQDDCDYIGFDYEEDQWDKEYTMQIRSVNYFVQGNPVFPRKASRELILFLKTKSERVDVFKKILEYHIELFLQINKKYEAINAFVDLLQQFEDLRYLKKSEYKEYL
jgi:hypothetical protein